MRKVDLNVDIGEGFPNDEALLEFATSANICCGEHAGSWELTQQTAELCKQKGVRIGAHPGYADREFMGRRPIEQAKSIEEWVGPIIPSVQRMAKVVSLSYVKPHGALYNDSAKPLPIGWNVESRPISAGSSHDPTANRFRANAPAAFEVMLLLPWVPALMGLPDSTHELIPHVWATIFGQRPKPLIREGFADRRYRSDGQLVSRDQPNAVLTDPQEVASQVLNLAPKVDSICLHGDMLNCLEFAEHVYKTLIDAGYEVGF